VAFLLEKSMTQEEVIAAIQEYATAIGHVPTFPELHKVTGIIKWTSRKHFGTYGRALAASGLKSHGSSGADPSPSPNSLPVVDACTGLRFGMAHGGGFSTIGLRVFVIRMASSQNVPSAPPR
jgi:hypothetical protein